MDEYNSKFNSLLGKLCSQQATHGHIEIQLVISFIRDIQRLLEQNLIIKSKEIETSIIVNMFGLQKYILRDLKLGIKYIDNVLVDECIVINDLLIFYIN